MTTTYIVSGYMRSGTSIMMRCLMAGGLRASYGESQDRLNQLHGREGYELCVETRRAIGFPRGFEGTLIKVLWDRVPLLAAGHYKIAYMLRDPLETAASVLEFWGSDTDDSERIESKAERIARINEVTLGILRQRRDVEVIPVSYHDVLDCPMRVFKRLKQEEWPIKPRRAADEVDLTMYRNRVCVPCQEQQRDE